MTLAVPTDADERRIGDAIAAPPGVTRSIAHVQSGVRTVTEMEAAFARGADVKLLGCNWHAAPYVMLARPGIERIEDLRGKSVAASSPGTPPDMVARAALMRPPPPMPRPTRKPPICT